MICESKGRFVITERSIVCVKLTNSFNKTNEHPSREGSTPTYSPEVHDNNHYSIKATSSEHTSFSFRSFGVTQPTPTVGHEPSSIHPPLGVFNSHCVNDSPYTPSKPSPLRKSINYTFNSPISSHDEHRSNLEGDSSNIDIKDKELNDTSIQMNRKIHPTLPNLKLQALHVSGLPIDVTEEEIRRYFLPFGPIKALNIPKSSDGSIKGYAKILYYDQQDARAALVNTNKGEIAGTTINVTLARFNEAETAKETTRRWQRAMDDPDNNKE